MDGYRTLRARGADSFIVKKSRFIGHGCPATSEEQALAFLAEIRQQYRDASHNCWAYVIGRNAGIMRYSDDGEPGGTAGMPIIEVIRAQGVVDCCVVVTRYFGGVLLGAGGLVRAYAQGAKVALAAAHVITMEDSVRLWAGMEYPLWGRVEHFLRTAPALTESVDFAATVTATLLVRARDLEAFTEGLAQITDGRVDCLEVERLSHGWEMPADEAETPAPAP